MSFANGWGKSIVDEIAADLQKDFPGIEGFSPRNIWRMRAFYLAWACDKPQPAVAKQGQKGAARTAPRRKRFLPQAVAEIPWGHNVTLLEKLKDSAQRAWYARQATANGWSRSMLYHTEVSLVSNHRRRRRPVGPVDFILLANARRRSGRSIRASVKAILGLH